MREFAAKGADWEGKASADEEYLRVKGKCLAIYLRCGGLEMRASSFRFQFFLHMPHVLRVVVIVLLVALVGGGVLLAVRGCSPGTNALAGGGTAISGVSVDNQFYAMGSSFIAFDGSYARAYDTQKGQLQWERSPDGTSGYQCATSSQLLALYKANSLYVYDQAGNVAFSTSTQQNIASVSAGLTRVAVCYEDDSIEVFDSIGKSVEVITPTEGKLMDYALYSSSDLLWMLLLNDEGVEPKSILNIHQPGKLLMAGYSTTDQIYYKPLMSGNQVYIVGTRTIDVRNTNDTSESSVLVYGWTLRDSCSSGTLNILFTLTQQGDSPTSLRVVSGGKPVDLHMPAGCTDLLMGTSCVYGFAGQTVYSVPIAGGKTTASSLPYAVDGVLCRLSDNRVLLSGQGQVWMVTLP